MRCFDSTIVTQSASTSKISSMLAAVCCAGYLRISKCTLLAVVLSVLLSCGSEDQDEGSLDTAENLAGVAIDPYLINATVYIDTNNNGMLDSWEPRALTDANGYFSVSIDGVDYCADENAEQYKYCLSSSVDTPSALIRVIGGYDSVTEEPFGGELSVRVNNLGNGEVKNTLVTPLTTIISVAETDEEKQTQLSLLGIEESDLDVDYLSTTLRTDLLSTTEKVVRAIGLIANLFDNYYDELGEDENLPTNSAGLIYKNITPLLASDGSLDIESVFSESVLSGILQKTENDIIALYNEGELNLPGVAITSEAGASQFGDKLTRLYQRIAQLLNLVDTIYSEKDFDSVDDTYAAVRLVEVVQQRIKKENDDEIANTEIDLLVELATNTGNANHSAFYDKLTQNNVDINALVETSFTTESEILNAVNYASDVTTFASLSGKKLLVNDPDNFTSRRKHARAELYFMGDQLADSGQLAMCIKTLSGAAAEEGNINSRDSNLLESGDTYGRYANAADGRWRILNSGYSVLIELDFAGGTYSAILKKSAASGEGDDRRYIFRFDLDDDLERWSSVEGLVLQDGSEPSTNDACKQRFNESVE